ncbi:Kelch-like protein 8 [Toxocara canis]|uniref:Kelch-like protein 8 n=1 Tax=Toxocara canis TaxID=6265 RepID=A0A0B2V1J7_TOXCA|nr:Kelch-like protein 8 [Toxocara canis]
MDDSMDFTPCAGGMLSNASLAHSQTQVHPSSGNTSESTHFADAQSTEYVDGLHSAQVLSNLDRFRTNSFMCDIEIEVEGNVFPAHRYVLAAAIPYFNSMFASDMRESRQQRISIQDIPASAFRQLLEFAYTSRVNINGENVQQLLYAASILQMDAVCSACQSFLTQYLTTANCLSIRHFAEQHNCITLLSSVDDFAMEHFAMDAVCSACQSFLTQYLTTANCLSIRHFAEQHNCITLLSSVDDFAMEHFAELRKLPEFLLIPIGHLLDLLRSPDLKVNNEQEVFETAMEWVQKAEHERKVHLPELLANVRLPQLPIAYFLNHVNKHPLVMENVRCRDLVGEAMSEMMRARLTPPTAASVDFSSHAVLSSSTVTPVTSGGGFVPNALYSQGPGVCAEPLRSSATCSTSIWTNCRPRKSAAGVIFCVGGRGTSGDPFRSVEAYDWRRNRWLSIGDMNVRRRHVGVVSAQGKLQVFA